MELVKVINDQPVTSSLQVAEVFGKQHKHVLEAIDDLNGVVENSADLFYEDTYIHPQNKQSYRQIIMTKKGWTLIAMGFTGKKATQFKLDYINAFDEMEEKLKQQQIDTSNLSPELQMFNGLFQSLAKQELATKKLETKVDNISDIVALNVTDWRKDCQKLIKRMAQTQGGFGAYQEINNLIYEETERRASANLSQRLTNKRRRMADEGASKSKRDRLNKLDVIGDDKRILEIYVAVVKEFAIKYGINLDDIA